MGGRLEVGLHGLGRGGLGRRGFKRLDREQRVDGRRLGLGFREAVAGGQRRLFEHADSVDQAIDVLAQARIGSGAVRRFQHDVERAIEFRLGADEVSERELLAAGFKVPVGLGDQDGDGIRRGCSGCSGVQQARRVPAAPPPMASVLSQIAQPETRYSADQRHDGEVSPSQHSSRFIDRRQRNMQVQLRSNCCGSAVYEGHPTWTNTLAASPASRAAGVTIVRSPISNFRPVFTARRTSSSQTNVPAQLASTVPAVPYGAVRFQSCSVGFGRQTSRCQEPIDPVRQCLGRNRFRGRLFADFWQRTWRRRWFQLPALWNLLERLEPWNLRWPQFVRDPLDIEQMFRRNVVRRDVAAEAAAAQRHRRIQTRRQADRAVGRGRVHANAVGRLVQSELEDDGVILRVDRHRVTHAAVAEDLLAALAAFAPVLDDVIREDGAELLDRQRVVAADALQLGDERARVRRAR